MIPALRDDGDYLAGSSSISPTQLRNLAPALNQGKAIKHESTLQSAAGLVLDVTVNFWASDDAKTSGRYPYLSICPGGISRERESEMPAAWFADGGSTSDSLREVDLAVGASAA